jgi:carbamoylphosphate synthase small subunit
MLKQNKNKGYIVQFEMWRDGIERSALRFTPQTIDHVLDKMAIQGGAGTDTKVIADYVRSRAVKKAVIVTDQSFVSEVTFTKVDFGRETVFITI